MFLDLPDINVNSLANKAAIDRRLRPRCCHLGSYFKRSKTSPVRPLACKWYYCAQFVAKPKAACALCFSWAATSSNLGLCANMTSSIKPEVHNISLRRQRRTEDPVRTWMGDRLRACIPYRYETSQLGQLSLASLRGRLVEYQLRLG